MLSMPVCTECGSPDILDAICQNCGSPKTLKTDHLETRSFHSPSVTQSADVHLATEAAPYAVKRRRSTLRPIDEQIAPQSDFIEEATDAGQDFPRLSTDAFIGEESDGDADEILLELSDLVSEPPPERARTEPELEALPKPTIFETCVNCGKKSDFSASIFCDHCGVRNPNRKRVGKAKDLGKARSSRSRQASKLVHRCKLCGYTVPSGSPACQNCGTPVL